tara:strand:- start:1631 stop:2017 length:387 start_codon:yes stop_codon:yes gene_type:complete
MKWLVVCLLLSGCGLSSLGLLGGGGGPTVNSNAQIGKENRQSVMSLEQTEEITAGRDVVQTEIVKEVETGTVENLDITNTNIPPWVILLLILGWLLPTPTEISRSIMDFILRLFGRKDNPKYERFKTK